jgi:hypothetical protein
MTDNTSIVVCGRKFDIGTRVVLWDEPRGFDAYSTHPYYTTEQDRQTGKEIKVVLTKGKRYSKRTAILRPGFEKLQRIVKQFFLHHSGLYRSRDTFHVLHNTRQLSVHFILDDDGTLYQTLDLREKAWHGGGNNSISVGIEIDSRADARKRPYAYDAAHQRKYRVGPRRVVADVINGHRFLGFDYSDAQYGTLIRLAKAMTEIFPLVKAEFPTDEEGRIIKATLARPKAHAGFICHYHNSRSKWDPVAFDYDRLLLGVASGNPDEPSVLPEEEPDMYSLATWKDRQQALAILGYDPGPIDGLPGRRTMAALKRFQAEEGLVADGIWGPKSNGAMRRALENLRD